VFRNPDFQHRTTVSHSLLTLAGKVGTDRATQSLALFGQLDIARYAHDVLLPRIWSLRDNLTAYDGAYVALAEVLGATLLTYDDRIHGATGVVARIEAP